MLNKIFKIIIIALSSFMIFIGLFFLLIEFINIFSFAFSPYAHPFNGLMRYISRVFQFMFFLAFGILSLIFNIRNNIYRTTLVIISSIFAFASSLLLITYMNTFVYLSFMFTSLAIGIIYFFNYFYPTYKGRMRDFFDSIREKK